MIEVDMRYDLLPGIDLRAYEAWAKKVIGTILQAPGIVEFRASRNMLGSPSVRATTVWQAMADWPTLPAVPPGRQWPPSSAASSAPTSASKSGGRRL
jgi:hypothetical protein